MGQTHTIGQCATTVAGDGNYTIVTYHSTQVVKYNQSEIILNSGGWRTHTTKTRMNQASNQFNLGYTVYQKDFDWFVEYNGLTLDFADNMKLIR